MKNWCSAATFHTASRVFLSILAPPPLPSPTDLDPLYYPRHWSSSLPTTNPTTLIEPRHSTPALTWPPPTSIRIPFCLMPQEHLSFRCFVGSVSITIKKSSTTYYLNAEKQHHPAQIQTVVKTPVTRSKNWHTSIARDKKWRSWHRHYSN